MLCYVSEDRPDLMGQLTDTSKAPLFQNLSKEYKMTDELVVRPLSYNQKSTDLGTAILFNGEFLEVHFSYQPEAYNYQQVKRCVGSNSKFYSVSKQPITSTNKNVNICCWCIWVPNLVQSCSKVYISYESKTQYILYGNNLLIFINRKVWRCKVTSF